VADYFDLFDDMARLPDDDDLPGPRRHTPKRHPMPCQPLGVLLAFVDSSDTSITPRRRARIQEHVRRCETCQMHVERVQEEVLHGVHEILKDALDVNQAAQRRRDKSFKQALHVQTKEMAPPLGSSYPLKDWLPIAATLAVILIGVLLFRPAIPVIHAEELIDRAMAYERAHVAGSHQRVRYTLNSGMITLRRTAPGKSGMPRIAPFSSIRDVADGAFVAEMRPASLSQRDAQFALARLFEKHHFDWRKPFCLSCYRAWHASLAHKRDSVTLTGDILTLRTTTTDSDLREVTLAFRRDTYQLVRQTFLFEGLGRIDIEELARRESAPPTQRASVAESRAVPGTIGTATPAPTAVARPPANGGPTQRLGLSRWLHRTFPKSAAATRDAFVPTIERRASAVRQHLTALQRLAKSSSSAKAKNGTEADRVEWQQQVEFEYQGLLAHLRSLEEHLNVLFGSGNRSIELKTLPDDWPRRAAAAIPHAKRLQHRLQRVFRYDDVPLDETRASRPGSARAAFEALWESLHDDSRE
jgi:hypothetical protein